MTAEVYVIVLGAALLHAGWNFFVKRSSDHFQGMASVVLGRGFFGVGALYFMPTVSSELLIYVALGVLLHLGYQVFLLNAYRLGDLTQVYPMARGSAPLLIALVSVGFGVRYTTAQLMALALIGTGLIGLSLGRLKESRLKGSTAAFWALITGCFIAGYSVVDGLGARHAGTALGYYGLVTTTNAVIFGVITRIIRPGLTGRIFREHLGETILSGGASFLAYSLVVWAFKHAPIALVASLRETSIIFALLMGVYLLKERVTPLKLVAIAVTLSGAVLLRVQSG